MKEEIVYCPMCDTEHDNNTLCQAPDPHDCGDHFPE
jgi:hypothetical protein